MPKTLSQTSFSDLLPKSIKDDPTVQAAASSLDTELQAVNSRLELPILLPRLNELPEEVVDLLAWQFHVDFWEPDLPIESKRDLVRQSIAWHKYKGTVWAVRQALIWAGFGDAEIKEHKQLIRAWIEAGGDLLDGEDTLDGSSDLSAPDGDFRFMTSHWAEFGIRANAAEIELSTGEQSRIRRMVNVAKPARSHLIGLEFYALYQLLSRVKLGTWSARIKSLYDKCGSAQVPHFEIIGWGCEELGGSLTPSYLDGDELLDGWGRIDGFSPDGEPLANGHWGTLQTKTKTPDYINTFGNTRTYSDTLDPAYRFELDYLDGSGNLAVETLSGNSQLDGNTDLSLEPLTRQTFDMLDGTEALVELPGPESVWHSGFVTWWHGNKHYREAI
jgi:phage tail P2-like protein